MLGFLEYTSCSTATVTVAHEHQVSLVDDQVCPIIYKVTEVVQRLAHLLQGVVGRDDLDALVSAEVVGDDRSESIVGRTI